jgi:hypothetical protein
MKMDVERYNKMLSENHILMIYSGPLWSEELDSLSEMLQSRLNLEELPENIAQAVFSVFIEQITNMMMYSAKTEMFGDGKDKNLEVPCGLLVLGTQEKTYFIQSGNLMKHSSVPRLKEKIEYLNKLDKKALRKYYKEKLYNGDDNPESKGAGLGLIEIARRASSKIDYDIIPQDNDMAYFTMYVTI